MRSLTLSSTLAFGFLYKGCEEAIGAQYKIVANIRIQCFNQVFLVVPIVVV